MALHVFEMTSGPDWVVAADVDDAWAVWSEHTGEKREDYEDSDGWEQLDDASDVRIAEDLSADALVWNTKTCAQWAADEGRCFLCSTEY